MVVTTSHGVHITRMIDMLVSLLLGGLRGRSSWMVRAKTPMGIFQGVVGQGVMNTPVKYTYKIVMSKDAFH